MKLLSKRKLALLCAGLGSVGAVSAFSFGATSALYTSQADSQNDSITTGTVTLGSNGATQNFTIGNLMPGDSVSSRTAPNHAYALTYSGSSPAFVGLDIALSSTAKSACAYYAGMADQSGLAPSDVESHCTGDPTDIGTMPLFDGSTTAGTVDLNLEPITGDTSAPLLINTNSIVQHGNPTCSTASGVVTCAATIKNLLVPDGYFKDTTPAGSGLVWNPNATDSVYFQVTLPGKAGNEFQGSTVNITLASRATQFVNNNTTNGAADEAPNTLLPATVWGPVPVPQSWS